MLQMYVIIPFYSYFMPENGILKAEISSLGKVELPNGRSLEVIPASDNVGCVDPRESLQFIELHGDPLKSPRLNVGRPEHEASAARFPGADAGLVMTLIAAVPDMPVARAVELVGEYAHRQGRKLLFHEGVPNHGGFGCGLVDAASQEENEKDYGLLSSKVREMVDILKVLPQQQERVEVPVLKGKHREKAVVVVRSLTETVNPNDGVDEYFRYDEDRHMLELFNLTYFLNHHGVAVTDEQMREKAIKQKDATVKLLANGLPVYRIDLRNGKREVSELGVVA